MFFGIPAAPGALGLDLGRRMAQVPDAGPWRSLGRVPQCWDSPSFSTVPSIHTTATAENTFRSHHNDLFSFIQPCFYQFYQCQARPDSEDFLCKRFDWELWVSAPELPMERHTGPALPKPSEKLLFPSLSRHTAFCGSLFRDLQGRADGINRLLVAK